MRDVLSQRWLKTEQTYQQRNAKRVYYLSMEFLLGRALANNISNLQLDRRRNSSPNITTLIRSRSSSKNRTPVWATAAWAGWRRVSSIRWRRFGIAGMGYGLRYDYGIFRQSLRNGWQAEQPDHWLARPDPWEVARPNEAVEVKLNVSFEIRDGALRVVEGRPSTLIGIPYDRPVVGYGGKTINTLRLWAVQASNDFDFAQFSNRRFRRRTGRNAHRRDDHARVVSRRSHDARQRSAVLAGILSCRLLADRPSSSFPRRRQ